MTTQKVGPYMRAEVLSDGIWLLLDRHSNTLATVEWYPRWKRYVLMPERGSVWSWDCLEAAAGWIRSLDEKEKA